MKARVETPKMETIDLRGTLKTALLGFCLGLAVTTTLTILSNL